MSLYKDTTYKDKSIHRYSIKASGTTVGSSDLDELINFVLDRGIDPTTELYVDGEKTEELLIDLIQE